MTVEKIWTNLYWQVRVKEMAEPLILRKMLASDCSRSKAMFGFQKWVSTKTNIRFNSIDTLTVSECKKVVTFLHEQRGSFKNPHSSAV